MQREKTCKRKLNKEKQKREVSLKTIKFIK